MTQDSYFGRLSGTVEKLSRYAARHRRGVRAHRQSRNMMVKSRWLGVFGMGVRARLDQPRRGCGAALFRQNAQHFR